MPCCYEPRGTMIILLVRESNRNVLNIRLFPGDGPDEAYAKLASTLLPVPTKGLPKPVDMEYGYCPWKEKLVIKGNKSCQLVPLSPRELVKFYNSIESLSLY